ncbi:MAG: ParB N-terminal domain-containing protein, partial [Chitinophagaceae bacterium]
MSKLKQNKEMLGKGIRSLLENIDVDLKTTAGKLQNSVMDAATNSNRISINLIDTNPKNPRKNFDEQALRELADSIRMHDIIQPLTVSKTANGRYQLIAGERRL